MPAFEVNGEGMSVPNNVCGSAAQHYTGKETVCCFQQFSLGAPAGWCTVSYNSLCSETSTISLPAIFFLMFLLLWKRLATRLSLVSSQKGAWRSAFFSEKFNFFSTWKDALSCRKRRRRWRFKSVNIALGCILMIRYINNTANIRIHKAICLNYQNALIFKPVKLYRASLRPINRFKKNNVVSHIQSLNRILVLAFSR